MLPPDFALLGPTKAREAAELYAGLSPSERDDFDRKSKEKQRRTIERRVKLFATPGARAMLGEAVCDQYIADAPGRLAKL
jgi:hypothetical protein